MGAEAQSPAPPVIYGHDDRHEVFEEKDASRRQLASSTVALVEDKNLLMTHDGNFELISKSYQEEDNLCPGERFAEQPTAASCTGFLVARDVVVTAGHCFDAKSSCSRTRFVFGYAIDGTMQSPVKVKSANVYRCRSVLALESPEEGPDYAVIRLDRRVYDREPLRVRRSGQVAVGADLFVMGHPNGLPLKIAAGARVRTCSVDSIVGNLDVFAGNSGSPVFNARSQEIEGILVAGEDDYEKVGKCQRAKRCRDDACKGEDITPIHHVLKFLRER